jgi:hypothetical protein
MKGYIDSLIVESSLSSGGGVRSFRKSLVISFEKRTLYDIKWHGLFDKWLDQESDILELREAILDLYPLNYEINDREWHAWKAFIRNAGCTNITPF